ncbi:PREDICTED: zinc finger protein 567-like [Polistes canadensis]|uniref:zinc finger protein 567-like n=1 Tax=Polistes canadensis TaxID=91411 RepID=UPI000718F966|nr:PREDICTED: zinc finger protein 567-like [Polistes canadensis]
MFLSRSRVTERLPLLLQMTRKINLSSGFYKCVYCSNNYQLKSSLKRHLRLGCRYESKQSINSSNIGNRRKNKGVLASMLLSTDVQQHYQERNNVSWSRSGGGGGIGYAGVSYRAMRSQRKKDTTTSTKNNGPENKYVCNRCGKTYKALTSLSRHRRLECGVVPCEVCPICDRRFKHRFVLNSHIVGCQRRLNHIIQKRSESPYLPEDRDNS